MTAKDDAPQSPAGSCYVVILEGPDTCRLTEYARRAEAVWAIEHEVGPMRTAGATIAGDLASGSVARWWERGHRVSLRIALGHVQEASGRVGGANTHLASDTDGNGRAAISQHEIVAPVWPQGVLPAVLPQQRM